MSESPEAIDGVDNPFGQFSGLATAHHEMYMSYVEAGFDTDQAFKLTMAIITIMLSKS